MGGRVLGRCSAGSGSSRAARGTGAVVGGGRRARGLVPWLRAVVLPLFNHDHHWQLSASPTVHSCLLYPGRAAPCPPSSTAPRPSPPRRRLSFNVIMPRDANRRHPCAECTKTFSTDNYMFRHWKKYHAEPRFGQSSSFVPLPRRRSGSRSCMRADPTHPRHSQSVLEFQEAARARCERTNNDENERASASALLSSFLRASFDPETDVSTCPLAATRRP